MENAKSRPITGKGIWPPAVWWMLGLLLLLSMLGWTILSHFFVFGEGHSERPLIPFLGVYWIAWMVFGVALLLLLRGSRPPTAYLIVVAVLARLILIPSSLIQENDVYRYVLDGQVLLHGENPYEHSPLRVTSASEGPLAESLAREEASQVLDRIGYPHIPTVYPPVAQLFFAWGALLGDWSWAGQRLVFLIADLGVILLLLFLLPLAGRARQWFLCYAWNPLILKEITNSAHLDVLVALFLLGLLGFLFRWQEKGGKLGLFWAGLAYGAAILSKIFPVILGPACLYFLYKNGKEWKTPAFFGLVTSSVVMLGYFPFWVDIGWERLTEGLTTYGEYWRMNDGVFALLALLTDRARWIIGVVIVICGFAIPWNLDARDLRSISTSFFWVLLIWYLLIPTPFPWYATALVGVAPLLRKRWIFPVLVLSGMVSLYYLRFFYLYVDYPDSWWIWTRAIEHGTIWTSVLYTALFVSDSEYPE